LERHAAQRKPDRAVRADVLINAAHMLDSTFSYDGGIVRRRTMSVVSNVAMMALYIFCLELLIHLFIHL
jgi:hypothetical protein